MAGLDLLSPVRRAFPLVTLTLLVACTGAEGPAGPQGPQGAQGDQGANGDDGANGAATLVVESELERGGEACPFGGLQTDSGLDNGDGGGVASDGTLQTGEIDATALQCYGPGGFEYADIPAGAAGTSTIDGSGGDATGGEGGNGGYFQIGGEGGGGIIALYETGAANTAFTSPDFSADYNFGAEALEVTSDYTLKRVANTSTLTAGDYFLFSQGSDIYRYIGNTVRGGQEYVQVTGLHVASGATLTVPTIFYPGDTDQLTNDVNLWVQNDLVLEGTLTFTGKGNPGNGPVLWLGSSGLIVTGPSSHIDAAGSVPTTRGITTGGYGGYVTINSGSWLPSGTNWNYLGVIQLQGTIDISGGSATIAGDGGAIWVRAGHRIFNTGTITSNGGDGDVGGEGGYIGLFAGNGIYNSGALSANGGGGQQAGGDGGNIELSGDHYVVGAEGYGEIVNSAALSVNGGSSTSGCTTNCSGGDAGLVEFFTEPGDIRTSGDLSANGGAGFAGLGGNGGGVYMRLESYSSYPPGARAAGSAEIAGNISFTGGTSNIEGGDGGSMAVYLEQWQGGQVRDQQSITFFGYQEVNLDGGSSPSCLYACNAGMAMIATGSFADQLALYNAVDISLNGGDASAGAGGNGGGFMMVRFNEYPSTLRTVANDGNVSAMGGSGVEGGYGGAMFLVATGAVSNTGDLAFSGGSGTTEGGGDGGGAIIRGQGGTASNSGDYAANGGNSAGSGAGRGGAFMLRGMLTDNSGTFTANGGSDTTGYGGGGGYLDLYSEDGLTVDTGASPSVSGGAGMTAEDGGRDGAFTVDGLLVLGEWYEGVNENVSIVEVRGR